MADPIDQIVTINITATSAAPTRKSFGIPLILAYHTHNADKVRTYFNTSDMLDDGFTSLEPAYYMAQAIVSQNPRPPSFKVGRLTTAVIQTFTFKVTNTTVGDSAGFDILSPLGVATDAHYTVLFGDTAAVIAAAIAAIVNPLPGVAAVSVGDTVTVTGASGGEIWYTSEMTGGEFTDTTVSANPQNDLAAILLVDNQFYGVSQQSFSAANISATAAWVEANKKIQCYTTADFANMTTPPSGIMGTLKTAGYKRTFGLWSGDPIDYCATGLMSNRLTPDPGSDTWAYKFIAGCSADILTSTQQQNITGNNGNFYISIARIVGVVDGRSAQGQFMDIQRGLDALENDIHTRVWALLSSVPKVPYTSKGIASVGAEVAASLASFVRTGFLSEDTGFEPKVLLPAIADVNPLDKRDRILRNVNFTATAQGAIHKVLINGTVNF